MTAALRPANVLGDGPRIAPLAVDELSDDLLAMLTRMAAINSAIDSRDQAPLIDLIDGRDGGSRGEASAADHRATLLAGLPEILRTMLRHPALFERLTDMGIQLLGRGLVPARDRELAILRIGWLCQAPYEWGEHVLIAHKAGVTPAEVEAITIGSTAPGWADHDRAILCATEELHATATISDTTWAMLARRFDARQLIELPVIIGQYQAAAYYQNAMRLRLHDGNPGLAAR